MSVVLPKVKALLLCQTAQKFNGMWSLQNIFNTINLDRLPASIGGFWFYLNLVDVRAPQGFKIEIDVIDPSDLINGEKSCGRGGIMAPALSKSIMNFEVAFPIPSGGITFEKAGVHDFKVYFNGDVLETMGMHVKVADGSGASGQAEETEI